MGSQEPDDPHAMVLHHFGRPYLAFLTLTVVRGKLETRVGEDDWAGPSGGGRVITLFVPGEFIFTALQETVT